MATTYNYSVTTDFGGADPKIRQLHDIIGADVGISSIIRGIDQTDDDIKITFESSLSAGEETILTGLLSAHIPNNSKSRTFFYTVNPKKNTINTSNYTTVAKFKYSGSDNIGTIDYINIISYMDSTVTSYSARLFDTINGLVLAEKTEITNTTETIIDLGTITNVPTDQSIFELQFKKVGGNNKKLVYIDDIIIYYGN
jgi:hypothetical protein